MDPIRFVSYDSNPKYENIWSVHLKGERIGDGPAAAAVPQLTRMRQILFQNQTASAVIRRLPLLLFRGQLLLSPGGVVMIYLLRPVSG